MPTIKERRVALLTALDDHIKVFKDSVYLPEIRQIEIDCGNIGHVNLETLTREDGSQYYICDNCKKLIELQ